MRKMMRRLALAFVLVSIALAVSRCGADSSPTATSVEAAGQGEPMMKIELESAAFAPGGPIPTRYTCDGDDISPPLQWSDPPTRTQSFALIVDDPDAPSGTWVHWVLYNLPADTRSLAEAIPSDADLQGGSRNGSNSWKRLGYGGPCPPGGTHRYFFKLYALDTVLNLDSGESKDSLLQALEGHILAQGELMGTYTRE
jgi:Raf kinase inhibitor-like YbhB/YbcL family protein